MKELENVTAAVKIDIDSLDKKLKEVNGELNKLPKRLKEFEQHTRDNKQDVFVKQMNEWMKSAKETMDDLQRNFKEMNERAIQLASTYAYKLEHGKVNEFLKIFNDFVTDWNKAKIKYTKLEEKKKKDALRAKKKEEAQKKLQAKLAKRTTTRKDLAKKNIFKDADKVKKEQEIKAKLKLTMKAHVRKQTAMQKMFSDVLNQSDEEEEDDDDETTDDEDNNPYKQYMKSYQNGGAPKAANVFNPDIIADNPESDVIQRDVSTLSTQSTQSVQSTNTVITHHHETQNSRGIPPLSDMSSVDDASPVPVLDDNVLDKSMSARGATEFDIENAFKAPLKPTKSSPNVTKKDKKDKKRKKKNDRQHNETPHNLNALGYKFRGQGRQISSDSKYDYASSGGIFKRGKPVPAATQFGNLWEMNFSPMSRMAHSNSNRSNINTKKKKKKYKSGHVRRETRLKKAFDQMKNIDLDIDGKQAVDTKKSSTKKSKTQTKTPKKQASKKQIDNKKSKGTEMYKNYKRNRTFTKPNKGTMSTKNVVEF